LSASTAIAIAGLIGFITEVRQYRPEASLGLLRRLLTQPNDVLRGVTEKAMQLGSTSLAARKLERFEVDSAEAAGVLSVARTQTAFLDSRVLVENLGASDFSFYELLTGNTTVYLVLPPERVQSYGRWLRLMVSIAIRAVANGRVGASDRLPVLCMLDDFEALGNLDVLERAFALMRGFDVSVWAFVQELEQLQQAYPKTWQSLIGNSQFVSILGVGDRETESYIANMAGVAPTGGGSHAQEIRRRRSELGVMVRPGKMLLCRRIEYFKDAPFSEAARPDPYYKGDGKGDGV
jgi:type IV secretion system protein VirD4